MQPGVWFTAHLEFTQNEHGNVSLQFRGYRYINATSNANGAVYWRCPQKSKGCRGRVSTRGLNQIKLGPSLHNHPPPLPPVAARKLTALPELLPATIKREPIELEDVVVLD